MRRTRGSLYDHQGVQGDNATFRKGLVLGLTLAELGILIIFILLLALGGLLAAKDAQLADLEKQLPREKAAERLLTTLAQKTNSSPQEVRGLTEELIAAAARENENQRLRRKQKETDERLSAIEDAVERTGGAGAGKADESPQDRSERLRKAVDGISAQVAAAKAALADVKTANNAHMVDALSSTRLENERLKGTVAYANRRLAALGKGTEKPACWATPQGAPEYIFDVTLFSGGIVTHDRKLPHRTAQQARLPISTIHFDGMTSGPAFLAQTRALFDWGEAHDCRFFVRIIDRTGASEKQRYKNLKLFVEGHFYKFDVR